MQEMIKFNRGSFDTNTVTIFFIVFVELYISLNLHILYIANEYILANCCLV